ncbi:hypothetical protein V8G54_003234 [Vigna mungo]|uniref:Uncharacterized protein n=1 Tax=Vigna mungo TaxID=3915 RepID=A0AAQ3PA40_VIGMU
MAGSSSSSIDMPELPPNFNILVIDTDCKVLELIEKSCNENSHQVMSEDNSHPSQEKAITLGVCHYWVKPFLDYTYMFERNLLSLSMIRHHFHCRRIKKNIDSLEDDEISETSYSSDGEAEADD